MNDDFLHRIRVEPPPDFLARLKSRLDLQPPPPKPASRLGRFRMLATLLLVSGSVFAITLMILNRGEPDSPMTAEPEHALQKQAVVAASKPTPSVNSANRSEAGPAKETGTNYIAVTTTSLQPYLSYLTETYFPNRGHGIKAVATQNVADALTQLCTRPEAGKSEQPKTRPSIALVTRRMGQSESEKCSRASGPFNENPVGYQVLVLARSKLYGAFSLTPAEIFLALASKVPDPAHPDKLIPNPNTVWSEINGALEREPIEVIGPSRSSAIGLALREILLETGCRSLPSMAATKDCPDVRTDGIYTEVANPRDIALILQTKPNAVGVTPYGLGSSSINSLVDIPIGGIEPSLQAIANDTYPGSRALYLYTNGSTWGPTSSYITSSLWFMGSDLQARFAIMPPRN
ncbi:MAG: substrate-binding domain-containing protein [Proteobacteria bacterium]|nr:substrate-binding domain-containing protein [Pseudomonadota bacterium]